MTTTALPICYKCKHFDIASVEVIRCAAFSDGIPFAIISSEHDHHSPYPGDNGIRFEPIPDTDRDEPPR